MERVDLHVHTTASDGTLTPRQTVALAGELGLAAVAVTDHDTLAGLPEAMAAGAELGVRVIPGIELAAEHAGREVHILGLLLDPEAPSILEAAAWAARGRDERNRRVIEALAANGIPVTAEAVQAENPGAVLGRPHIAAWLAGHGYVASAKEAMDHWFRSGQRYYRPRPWMALDRAAAAIRGAGGVAVMAHPLQYSWRGQALEDYLRAGMAAGCRALEAYYSEHSPQDQAMLLAAADRLGLAVSGGSDFHGARKPRIRMGTGVDGGLFVPAAVLEGLEKAKF